VGLRRKTEVGQPTVATPGEAEPEEPAEPQDMACTRRFSRHIVSSRSRRSSAKISLSHLMKI
jgi:hypothetical protein